MRKNWDLPGEEWIHQSRPDWLLLLLQKVDKITGAQLLMLM
jgi:hypothetical protein